MTQLNQTNKALVWDFWQRLDSGETSEIEAVAQSAMLEDVQWHGFDPVGNLQGVKMFSAEFWRPLLHAVNSHTSLYQGWSSNVYQGSPSKVYQAVRCSSCANGDDLGSVR